MKVLKAVIVKGTAWTIGSFAFSQSLRIVSSIILAYLLAPELFGIMVVVYSIRTGVDLLSDVGIGQSVVASKNSEKPEFYNTAWTLRFVRGLLLWAICIAAAVPLAHIYQAPMLMWVLPVAALYFVFGGLNSLSIVLMQQRLRYARLNTFEVIVELISTVSQVVLAIISPTIWALVFGGLVASVTRTIGTYVLMPELRHRFCFSKEYAMQIFTFGKWIFLSSTAYFLSTNFDRLYLGTVISLQLLGVYGIARILPDSLNTLVSRLNFTVFFPFIVSHSDMPRAELRAQLISLRAKFLLIAAVGFSSFAAIADLLIRTLYDHRYHDAGWMLPVLVVGAWFSMLCSINESTLMGLRKPSYAAYGNGSKFGWLLIGLPLGVTAHGMVGVIVVVAVSDLFRYIPILVGQIRERFSFALQDLSITLVMFGLIGVWEGARWILGFGTSFDQLPIWHRQE